MSTKLDVMNAMLSAVGEQPVSSATSGHPTAIACSVQIDKINKEFQERGWWFNQEGKLNLLPEDTTGNIVLPNGTLDVDPDDVNSTLVQRGNRMYDPVNHTFAINQAVIVNLVLQLETEDLPEIAAAYLKAKCVYDFYVNDDGDEQKAARLEKESMIKWAALQQAQLQNADVNASNRPITAILRSRINSGFSRSNPTWPGGGR